MESQTTLANLSFLSGVGEAGEYIRRFDWSKTSIGTPDTWPQSLRTTLGIMLQSAFPMALLWGEEGIYFHNDALKPWLLANSEGPFIGRKYQDIWPLYWDYICQQIRRCANGEKMLYEDSPMSVQRDGKIKEAFWSASYSPVYGDDGTYAGTLLINTETTDKIVTIRRLRESEQRFLNLLRETTLGIGVMTGDDWKLSIVNDAFARVIGRTASEMLHKNLFAFDPGLDPVVRPILEEVNETGKTMYLYEYPYGIPGPDGNMINGFIDVIFQPYREEDGRMTGVMVLCQDISEKMEARRKALESEHQLRAVVDSAPFPIAVYIGREMRIALVNQAIIDVWGKGPDVIGKTYYEVLPELEEQGIFPTLDNVFVTGIPLHVRNERVDLVMNGKLETFYFNYSFTPLYDGNGEIYGVMNTAAEVTDANLARQRIEEVVAERTQELASANENLMRSNDELAQFAHIASHDLQEPLRKISTFTEMLQNRAGDRLDDSSKNYLSKINSSAVRMNSLIRDVLSYSELVKDNVVFSKVDLNEIVGSTISDYELLVEQKKASIHIGELPVIEAIPLQMAQLFGNLIGNSLKFARKDKKPEISIVAEMISPEELSALSLDPNLEYCKIVLRDNGIGLQPEHSEKIFQIFQRLHRKSEYEGTGIGLAMCRKIALNHRGDLNAQGSSEEGAVFNVILPLRMQHENQ